MAIASKVADKLGNLKVPIIGGLLPGQKPQEDEKLLKLFQNRAGLKKAHAGLQDQIYELKDRLKQQEGAHTRLQEQLEFLENLLGNPDSGHGALVYFQLRGLWRACFIQLEQFAEELSRQQEERERRKQVAEFELQQQESLNGIDARIAAAQAGQDEQQQTLSGLQLQHARLRGFWNYFRRRRLLPQIDRQRLLHEEAVRATETLRGERNDIARRDCDEFPGLSLEGRRSINLAILAYALVLGGRLSILGLAARAKDAILKRVNDAHFGSRAECEALMAQIAQALAVVKSRRDLAVEIKKCIEEMKEVARYRTDHETVPLADTLASVVPATPGGRGVMMLSGPQILADDYWYVYKVLLR